MPPGEIIYIYISSTKENLEKIVVSHNLMDDVSLGECCGFPETAIQAYVGERNRLHTNLKLNTRIEKCLILKLFTQFIFSYDFYIEEMKIPLEWQNTIKNKSPKLFKKIIEKEKKIKPFLNVEDKDIEKEFLSRINENYFFEIMNNYEERVLL